MIEEKILNQIKPGVRVRVNEGRSYFEGLVIARKHGKEAGGTFTVRSIVRGVGVERVYPIHSPVITSVKILQKPKRVRRSKLYYVRELSGKKIRKKLGVSV